MMMGFASMSEEFPELQRRSPGLRGFSTVENSTVEDLSAMVELSMADKIRRKHLESRVRRETGSAEACVDSFLPFESSSSSSGVLIPPLTSCPTPERAPRAAVAPSPRRQMSICADEEEGQTETPALLPAGSLEVAWTPRKSPHQQRGPTLCDVLRSSIEKLPRMRVSMDSVRINGSESDCDDTGDEELWMHNVYEPRALGSKTPRTALLHSLGQAIARTAAEDGLARSDCSWGSVVDGLQNALTDHLHDPAMVEAICGMMTSLLDKHSGAADLVDPRHVLSNLKSALEKHGGSRASVVVGICTAVDAVCSKTAAGRSEARLLCLLDSMQAHLVGCHAKPEVQGEVCSAIWAICTGSPENKHYAGQIGLLNTLQDALEQNADRCKSLHDCGHDAVGAICQANKNNTWLALRLGLWHTNER